MVPDNFDENFKETNKLKILPLRDYDAVNGCIKPRRGDPTVKASDFLSSLVCLHDNNNSGVSRWVFSGVLNGWPGLTCLELLRIEFKGQLPRWRTFWSPDKDQPPSFPVRSSYQIVPDRINVSIEDGSHCQFRAVIETPRGSNAVCIRNTAQMEFPVTACVDVDVEDGAGVAASNPNANGMDRPFYAIIISVAQSIESLPIYESKHYKFHDKNKENSSPSIKGLLHKTLREFITYSSLSGVDSMVTTKIISNYQEC